jgi:hypothetical protein
MGLNNLFSYCRCVGVFTIVSAEINDFSWQAFSFYPPVATAAIKVRKTL